MAQQTINDLTSRCECCGQITHSNRLHNVTGIIPYPALPAAICGDCHNTLIDLEMQFRAPQTLGNVRAARTASAA